MGAIKPRLGGMMFLQYAVWGFWLPILARYLQAEEGGLGFTPGQVGWILGLAASSGAIVAPFLAGQIADRYFATEKFLAALLLIGGVILWVVSYQTSFAAWLILSVLYSIVYQPTIALTNSLAFANLKDADEFPRVRVWGTIGWIAASWIFPWVVLQTNLQFQLLPPFLVGEEVADSTARIVDAMKWSGTVSILYAVYSFFALPHTPPKRDAVESLAFAKAFALLRHPSFALLVAASLPISVIHQIYFVQTSPFLGEALGLKNSHIGPAMSIGQFAEIGVLAALPFMLKALGFRWTMCIGGMAYFLRYAIFGTLGLPVAVIVSSQALHGFCFACFFATAFIYVDRIAPADVRNSAQTVFGIIILGLGPIISAPVLGALSKRFTVDGVMNYSGLWYTLAGVALVTTVIFGLLWRDETQGQDGETEANAE
jgi:nucleoside transporter